MLQAALLKGWASWWCRWTTVAGAYPGRFVQFLRTNGGVSRAAENV